MNSTQARILSIYKVIAELCDKHNIDFYAIGGTCLGAVRHKGFIPWDDDIDIAIPVEQFFKFQKIARKELPDYLEVYTCKDREHCLNIFIKVVDNRTTFIEKRDEEYPDVYKGIFVDIMPLGGVPDPGIKRKIFYKKVKLIRTLNRNRRRPVKEPDEKFVNRMFAKLAAKLTKKMDYNTFSNAWYKYLLKHKFKDSNYVGYTWNTKLEKVTVKKEYFSSTVDLEFENFVMRCPVGYDEYLTQQFGNYMELPPENMRLSGHEGLVDETTSYKEYKKHPEMIKNRKQ